MTAPSIIRFADFRLDRISGELSRGGTTTRLSQQPLRVLIELLDNPGKVVSRERLVTLLWPRGVVDFDNSLNGIVRKVRVALGDDSETPRYIETLPRVGYRYIGPLDDAPTEESPMLRAHRKSRRVVWFVAAGVVMLATGAWFVERARRPQEPVEAASLAPRRTTSTKAYEHYLDGIYQRSRRDINATPQAIAAFEAALREDPDYAEAWAALATTLTGAALWQQDATISLLDRARDAAERAVKLDESLADGHAALGQVHTMYTRDLSAAEREFARALALDDKLSRGWHGVGILRAFQGRPEEALAAMRRARELEPMTLHFNSQYGLLLYHSRRFDDAIAHLEPLVAAQPSLDQARSVLIRALIAKGRYDDASAHLKRRTTDIPNMSDLGLLFARTGRREDALAEAQRIEARDREGYAVMYEVAVIYAALGELDQACGALANAADEHSMFVGWARLDPRMDGLRGKSCFSAVERTLDTSAKASP
jgi:DNA-binding winged helix-turn-helix (wHTH) protein/tetratricopeptide (TPR) repeat protein